jgi:hypothetical protein
VKNVTGFALIDAWLSDSPWRHEMIAEGQGEEEGQEQREPEDRDRKTDQRNGADQGIGLASGLRPLRPAV